ncbi:M20 family metallopeptidase [Salinifilum ghardaiensis]
MHESCPERPVTPEERAVLDLISAEEITELTRALLAAPGENPPGGESATAAVLAEACRSRELPCELTEVAPGRPNASARLGGTGEPAGPGLLLLGHTDVVPIGDGWTVDPLGGAVRDGRLYGRGATDMKGGLAACVVAMSALREAGAALSGPVELAAVVDEEEDGLGIQHYVASGDRGGFTGCIVAEPTGLQTITAARGDAYAEVAVRGRAAHAGRPSDGANAIYGAAAVIAELETWHEELGRAPHPLLGPASWSVGQVRGGTGTAVVPAECVVQADRRLLPGETGEDVLAALTARLDALGLQERGLGAQARMTMEMPGFETSPEDGFVLATDGALRAAGGPGHPVGGWTAACDGGFVQRDTGVPVVVLGPGSVAEQAHTADESVGIDELHLAARAYALAAMRLLAG